jgi:glucose-1-phosphate thymidylyltransferase
MKVVLPMAGFGTRLRPLTWSKPKPLVQVAGKAILGHVLDMFCNLAELDEVIFITGFLGDQVQEYVQRVFPDVHARYVEQKDLLGQSQALWLAKDFIQGPIVVSFVDTLIDVDFSASIGQSKEAIAWVKRVEDPRRFGVAQLGADGRVRRLMEKPADKENNLVVVGSYFFPSGADLIQAVRRQIENGVTLGGEFYLADAINLLLADGLRMRAEEVAHWEDCGKPETLLHANRYLLDHGRENSTQCPAEGVVVIPPVFIDPESKVERSVIGPYVSLAAGCRVENSIMRDTIADEKAEISHMVISDSLIGSQARLLGKYGTYLVGDSSEMRAG